MAKKSVKKKLIVKESKDIVKEPKPVQQKTPKKIPSEMKTEQILVENFIALQKVMTHLAGKMDDLTNQISKLLQLFELSAKALAEKEFEGDKLNKKSEEILERLDNLSEQNKILAKGMMLKEDNSSEIKIPKLPFRQEAPTPVQNLPVPRVEGYQKSISSREQKFNLAQE